MIPGEIATNGDDPMPVRLKLNIPSDVVMIMGTPRNPG
jgi:hypothetical protein